MAIATPKFGGDLDTGPWSTKTNGSCDELRHLLSRWYMIYPMNFSHFRTSPSWNTQQSTDITDPTRGTRKVPRVHVSQLQTAPTWVDDFPKFPMVGYWSLEGISNQIRYLLWGLDKQTHRDFFEWFPKGQPTRPSCIYWDGCRDVANHWLPKIAQESTKKDRFSTHKEILRVLGSLVHQKEKYTWVFPKIGVPQNGWYIMEKPIKMDDLGGPPLFLETPTYIWGGETSFNAENQRSCFANCHMTETIMCFFLRQLCDIYIYTPLIPLKIGGDLFVSYGISNCNT